MSGGHLLVNCVGINCHLTAAMLDLVVEWLGLPLRILSSRLVDGAWQPNVKSVALVAQLSDLAAETVD